MNVTPKASALDVAGVVGLISFLADKKACADRLDELTAAALAATVAENKAAETLAQASTAIGAADDVVKAAHKLYDENVAAKLVVADQQTELEDRLGKVAKDEKNNVETATALTSLEIRLKTRETDLETREAALDHEEVEVAELKKEYESKLDKLRALSA